MASSRRQAVSLRVNANAERAAWSAPHCIFCRACSREWFYKLQHMHRAQAMRRHAPRQRRGALARALSWLQSRAGGWLGVAAGLGLGLAAYELLLRRGAGHLGAGSPCI